MDAPPSKEYAYMAWVMCISNCLHTFVLSKLHCKDMKLDSHDGIAFSGDRNALRWCQNKDTEIHYVERTYKNNPQTNYLRQ